MNTFFEKRLGSKWKSPSGIKNEIVFIITNRRDIVQDVTIINKVNVGSNHRLVRSKVILQLRRERNKLIQKPLVNLTNIKNRMTEFSINIRNKYSALEQDLDIDQMNGQFSEILKEAAH